MNKENLVSGLKHLLNKPELQGAVSSMVVKDSKNNTILGYNPGLYLSPASNIKLITTATALHLLGKDYRFHTNVSYTGAIEAGKVTGNLVVKGFGDPTLGSRQFEETLPLVVFKKIADFLKALSVTEIEGDIIIDNSYIQNKYTYADWVLEDYPWYYGAIPQALNFLDNSFAIRQSGHKIIPEDTPGVDGKLFLNECEIFEDTSIDEIKALGSPTCSKKSVFFNPALDASKIKEEKLSLANPGLVFKAGLRNYLIANGIKVNAGNKAADSDLHEIGTLNSPPLSEIIKVTNFKSHNLFAECTYLALTKVLDEKKENLNIYWQNILGNSKFNTCDGSGLARKNLSTTVFLSELLMHMFMNKDKFGDFIQTLPLLGKDGTVKDYGKDTRAKNTVRMKTGSMSKVRAFAGVVQGTETLSFSMIFNNYQCTDAEMRTLCDAIFKELATA